MAATAAFVTGLIMKETGSPEMADAGGQAAGQLGGNFFALIFGALMGLITLGRKSVQDRLGGEE